MNLKPVLTIAAIEWKVNLRNKWMAIFTAVFSLLALAISYAGTRAEGFTGLQSFSRTSASLLNLVLYLAPLISIVMGTISFTSDKGALELLVAQPVRRRDVVIGKIIGMFASIFAATSLGFIAAGAFIAPMSGGSGLGSYIALAILTQTLALIFLILSTLIALLNDRRQKAFGYALFGWFFFVLFYDLIVIGLTVVLGDVAAKNVIFFSLFGNPVDIVRVASLILLENATIFGAAGAMLIRFLGGPLGAISLLLASLILWVLLPLWAALRAANRQDF